MEISLDGRNALITGGSQGLGRAMAKEFCDSGANVAIVARQQDALDRAVAEISKSGRGKIVGIAADISTAKGCEQAFEAAITPRTKAVLLNSPHNPTGAVARRDQLRAWVEYALKNEAILLYDGAYEAFITEDDVPHSIFEIPGARECAIEFRSFSKNGGFT